jgi:probable HAF family extracellular repeat protein
MRSCICSYWVLSDLINGCRGSQKKEINMKLRINMKSSLAGLFAMVLMAVAVSSQAQSYNITDLGALPGDTISFPAGLNSLGQAAGTSANATSGIATLYRNGNAISLGTLGASDSSFAQAINGSGQVVGYDWFSSGVGHAFLYSNGRMTDIHSASLFPNGSTAQGINSSGQVVGYGWINGADDHAFLYSGGRTVDLGTLGGNESMALAINDAGQIVGHSTTASDVVHAFLYSNGKITDLGMPAGAVSSSALAINRAGQIVGEIEINSSSHAALYNGGVWTDLGTVAGATLGALATGINGAGQIVGQATFPKVLIRPASPGKRALYKPSFRVGFIASNGALVDLNTLIPANSGYAITGAVGINDLGEILCSATTASSASRAIVLTPK